MACEGYCEWGSAIIRVIKSLSVLHHVSGGCEVGLTGAKFRGGISKDNSVYSNKFIYVKCTILLM